MEISLIEHRLCIDPDLHHEVGTWRTASLLHKIIWKRCQNYARTTKCVHKVTIFKYMHKGGTFYRDFLQTMNLDNEQKCCFPEYEDLYNFLEEFCSS